MVFQDVSLWLLWKIWYEEQKELYACMSDGVPDSAVEEAVCICACVCVCEGEGETEQDFVLRCNSMIVSCFLYHVIFLQLLHGRC